MLLRIQLENIGLIPTILTAFHILLPMEQNCIYGIYFYRISKQSGPAALSFCGGQTPTDLRENTKKSLTKRSKPKIVKSKSRLYGFAVA